MHPPALSCDVPRKTASGNTYVHAPALLFIFHMGVTDH